MQMTLNQFVNFVEERELSVNQREVLFHLLRLGGRGTMHDISLSMRKPVHAISGRFSELERKGCVMRAYKRGRWTVYELMEKQEAEKDG